MSSLYELTADFIKVLDMAGDSEFSDEAIRDTLEAIDGEIEDKADGYAKVIKNLEADMDALKKEESRLNAKRKTIENRIKFLKFSLENAMRVTGKTKFKTLLFSFSIQKNGGAKPLIIKGDIPKEYMVEQEPVPNNDAIRELLKNGNVDWAELGESGESLRIR